MARKTATRKPVSTSAVISRPSSTTIPIAAGHDIRVATWNATKALRPSPVASANGYRPINPIAIVSTQATSAVAAATAASAGAWPPPRNLPSASLTVPMMSGFSTTM